MKGKQKPEAWQSSKTKCRLAAEHQSAKLAQSRDGLPVNRNTSQTKYRGETHMKHYTVRMLSALLASRLPTDQVGRPMDGARPINEGK